MRKPSAHHVWGVDVAISHLAIAYAPLNDPGDPSVPAIPVETLITRTEETEGARLGLLDRQLRIYATQAAGRYPPACVWIEQASGRFQRPQLLYAIGVIQAAFFETLAVPVWTIPSSAWKKRAVGAGNATKPQIQAALERAGHSFDGEHQADAIGIALAGRAMLQAESWDAAA